MKNTLLLLLFASVVVLASCAGVPPEQQVAVGTGIVAAIGGTADAIITAVAPWLPPEKVAQLHAYAASGVQAAQVIAQAIGTLAEQVSAAKASAATAATSHATLSLGDAMMIGGGGATAAVAAVQALRGPSGTTEEKAKRRAAHKGKPA